MAGLVPAIPIGRELRFSDRDHRHKAGDDVGRSLGLGSCEPSRNDSDGLVGGFLSNHRNTPPEFPGTVAVQLAFGLHMFQANTCAAAGRIQSQGIER